MNNIDEILKDIKKKLNTTINEKDIHYFDEGKSEATVFSISNKYLIKICNKIELDVYREFLSRYQSEYFQKIYYINYELSYICLSYTEGTKYNDDLDNEYLIGALYDITSNYKSIDYDGYGYLFEDHKTWSEFLIDEIEYSNSILKTDGVDKKIVYEALDKISNYKADKCLINGDLGTHNFIVNKGKLYIIDPMGLVGDPIYDFYFAVFSNTYIFKSITIEELLKFFDKDINYKKLIIIITFYIRLCRTYKYNNKEFKDYLDYYTNVIGKLEV